MVEKTQLFSFTPFVLAHWLGYQNEDWEMAVFYIFVLKSYLFWKDKSSPAQDRPFFFLVPDI